MTLGELPQVVHRILWKIQVTRLVASLITISAVLGIQAARAQDPVVYHVRIASIDQDLGGFVDLALESAQREPGSVVVLEMGASGGQLDIAQMLVSKLTGTPVPVYAFVNSRALSSAALVVLATDSIFMVPVSSIGGGAWSELRDSTESAIRSVRDQFGTLAERRGLDPLIGEAMVDQQIRIRGLVALGDVLTLESDDAVRIGLATAQVADLTDLLIRLDLQDAEIVTSGPEWTGTTVGITNNNSMDIRVFLRRAGSRYVLGTVPSMSSATFGVAEALIPDGVRIDLVADLIGSSQRVTSEQIRVQPGIVIQWVIEPTLSQSNLSYFIR